MRFSALVAIPGLLALTACAPGPSAVAPMSMGNAFAQTDCRQVVPMLNQARATEADLTRRQRNAATGDAIGTFLILVPVSSVTGNNVEGELAEAKGRTIALENRARDCGMAPIL